MTIAEILRNLNDVNSRIDDYENQLQRSHDLDEIEQLELDLDDLYLDCEELENSISNELSIQRVLLDSLIKFSNNNISVDDAIAITQINIDVIVNHG